MGLKGSFLPTVNSVDVVSGNASLGINGLNLPTVNSIDMLCLHACCIS